MFKTLTDTSKAAIFSGLVLILAVAAALAIKALGLASTARLWAMVWSSTPALATVIMLLVVTRDGRSRQGWRSLGLHRLGLRLWPIAIFGTLLITVVASAVVWLTPLASVVVPAVGGAQPHHLLAGLPGGRARALQLSQKRSGSGATCFPNCCPWVVNEPFWCLGSCGPPGTCR